METEEKEMIYNVFDFGQSCAKDIMVPRTDMVCIDLDVTYNEIMELYREEQFSRMPVYQETHDHIVGVLHIKDLILNTISPESFSVKDYLREAYFVHEFKNSNELFQDMRIKKIGLAIVLDEYGGTAGIVSMEDLIEEIVGDINDEYDSVQDDFVKVNEQEYVVDGTSRISEVNEELGLDITSDDFDSIGGFVIGLFDRFPSTGEQISYKNVNFIVEDTINNRINSLRLLLKTDQEIDQNAM